MANLSIEVTNACNRDCIHCFRDKLEPRQHLPLDLFKQILRQAHQCGIRHISLTGGEPTLHPAWSDLLFALAERGLKFSILTNGYQFKQRTLPMVLKPTVRRHLNSICFSLDGASANSHDALRGEGSFHEVTEAANLCRLSNIPFKIKTVVTNGNKKELAEIALLGSALGTKQHSFLALVPTPRSLEQALVPSVREMRELYSLITGSLVSAMKADITLEGPWGCNSALFTCNAYQQFYSVDHLGNLLFCCNLSHVYTEAKLETMGREFLADLKEEPLEKGIIQHYRLLARFTEDRLDEARYRTVLFPYPCLWCLKYFGKLEWAKNYHCFPWVEEMFGSHYTSVNK